MTRLPLRVPEPPLTSSFAFVKLGSRAASSPLAKRPDHSENKDAKALHSDSSSQLVGEVVDGHGTASQQGDAEA